MDAIKAYILQRAARRRGCATTDPLPAGLTREEYIAALYQLEFDSYLVGDVRAGKTVFFLTWRGQELIEEMKSAVEKPKKDRENVKTQNLQKNGESREK